METKEETLAALKKSIIEGKAEESTALTKKGMEDGINVRDVLNSMTDAMTVVGDLYARKQYYLPNVLTSANAFDKGFQLVQPLLEAGTDKGKSAKVIIGVCEGDIHDIGKKIVTAMMRGAGFEVIDLGRDVPNDDFIAEQKKSGALIVAMSALMSTSITEIRGFVELSKEEGVRDKIKLMIGGGSVTKEFAEQIGADGYGVDSATAVKVAEELSRA
jgi:methanogenic corrinoid protein MtbC1